MLIKMKIRTTGAILKVVIFCMGIIVFGSSAVTCADQIGNDK